MLVIDPGGQRLPQGRRAANGRPYRLPLAPSARGRRPQAVGERTVRLPEIFRAMARFSPSAPSGHRSPSGASATSPVSGESVSQREARPRPPLRGGCRRSDWGREPCHCPKPTRTEKPSPSGEGGCGPDHRRMRGSLPDIARKQAIPAAWPSSGLAAHGHLPPRGEGFILTFSITPKGRRRVCPAAGIILGC